MPSRAQGATPAGWDCWGCVAYLRLEVFGRPTPAHGDLYVPGDVRDLAKVESLFAAHMDGWRPVPPRPGAVLLFEVFGRAAHVGLMLTRRDFIHALEGCETALVRLDGRWADRMRGAYDTTDDREPRP